MLQLNRVGHTVLSALTGSQPATTAGVLFKVKTFNRYRTKWNGTKTDLGESLKEESLTPFSRQVDFNLHWSK